LLLAPITYAIGKIAPHGLREGSRHLNPVFDLWQYPAATGHRLRFRDNPRADKGC